MDHQKRLVTENLEEAAHRLRCARLAFISAGIVSLPKADLGFHRGLAVRDPDGHAMEFVER
jgi:hypothetical protein